MAPIVAPFARARAYPLAVAALRTAYRRRRTVVLEMTRFGIVGAVNTVLDVAVFNLVAFVLGAPVLAAKTVAAVVATTSSFLMNRHWSFAHRSRTGLRREYVLFVVVNVVALALSLLVLAVARYALDLRGVVELNVANLLATGVGTAVRFLSYRRFIWRLPV